MSWVHALRYRHGKCKPSVETAKRLESITGIPWMDLYFWQRGDRLNVPLGEVPPALFGTCPSALGRAPPRRFRPREMRRTFNASRLFCKIV